MVNQGPRQSDDQMSGKRVSGMRHLKTALVALSDRQSTVLIQLWSYPGIRFPKKEASFLVVSKPLAYKAQG